jgi:hypothetical protein
MRIVPSSQTGPHTYAPQHPHPVCGPRRFPLGGAFALGHCRSRLTRWNRSIPRRGSWSLATPCSDRTGMGAGGASTRCLRPRDGRRGEDRRAIGLQVFAELDTGGGLPSPFADRALRSSSGFAGLDHSGPLRRPLRTTQHDGNLGQASVRARVFGTKVHAQPFSWRQQAGTMRFFPVQLLNPPGAIPGAEFFYSRFEAYVRNILERQACSRVNRVRISAKRRKRWIANT